MKKVLLAVGLGLGVLTFTMAGTYNATAPVSLKHDTVPEDTTEPAPEPDTTSFSINR